MFTFINNIITLCKYMVIRLIHYTNMILFQQKKHQQTQQKMILQYKTIVDEFDDNADYCGCNLCYSATNTLFFLTHKLEITNKIE